MCGCRCTRKNSQIFVTYMDKKRNDTIDILKFLAVVLILNSHFDGIYIPPFNKVATGGTIGDALFFFVQDSQCSLGGTRILLIITRKDFIGYILL